MGCNCGNRREVLKQAMASAQKGNPSQAAARLAVVAASMAQDARKLFTPVLARPKGR